MCSKPVHRMTMWGIVVLLILTFAVPASAKPHSVGPFSTTTDNENNTHTGSADGDMDQIISSGDSNHPIEFNIYSTWARPAISALLILRVFDVDEADGEEDPVFFNGNQVGTLDGFDNAWSESVFSIPVGIIQQGNNLIEIQVDEDWVVEVDWGELVIDGGGQVLKEPEHVTVNTGDTLARTVHIPAPLELATFIAEWSGSQIDLVVDTPGGRLQEGQPGVAHEKTSTSEYWSKQPAEAGEYTMRLTAVNAEDTAVTISAYGPGGGPPGGAGGNRGSIRGTVFEDANGSGALDEGEAGMPGVGVVLTSVGGWTHTFYSGDDGTYAPVALNTAYYSVRLIVPPGYVPTGSVEYQGVEMAGNVVLGIDFGLAQEDAAPAAILLPASGNEGGQPRPVVVVVLTLSGIPLLGLGLLLQRRRVLEPAGSSALIASDKGAQQVWRAGSLTCPAPQGFLNGDRSMSRTALADACRCRSLFAGPRLLPFHVCPWFLDK